MNDQKTNISICSTSPVLSHAPLELAWPRDVEDNKNTIRQKETLGPVNLDQSRETRLENHLELNCSIYEMRN